VAARQAAAAAARRKGARRRADKREAEEAKREAETESETEAKADAEAEAEERRAAVRARVAALLRRFGAREAFSVFQGHVQQALAGCEASTCVRAARGRRRHKRLSWAGRVLALLGTRRICSTSAYEGRW
jgi:hypothetical protein